ncbi:MAG: AF1514 family protein [Gemmatimonadota bacterium]
MDINEVETITLDLDGETSLTEAQAQAREAAQADKENLSLIAWYDRKRETGGPSEACAGEVPKCIRDYATSHGSRKRVWVNDGEFEFHFSPTGKDVEELDREWALRVHEGAKTSEHDNVQGG